MSTTTTQRKAKAKAVPPAQMQSAAAVMWAPAVDAPDARPSAAADPQLVTGHFQEPSAEAKLIAECARFEMLHQNWWQVIDLASEDATCVDTNAAGAPLSDAMDESIATLVDMQATTWEGIAARFRAVWTDDQEFRRLSQNRPAGNERLNHALFRDMAALLGLLPAGSTAATQAVVPAPGIRSAQPSVLTVMMDQLAEVHAQYDVAAASLASLDRDAPSLIRSHWEDVASLTMDQMEMLSHAASTLRAQTIEEAVFMVMMAADAIEDIDTFNLGEAQEKKTRTKARRAVYSSLFHLIKLVSRPSLMALRSFYMPLRMDPLETGLEATKQVLDELDAPDKKGVA